MTLYFLYRVHYSEAQDSCVLLYEIEPVALVKDLSTAIIWSDYNTRFFQPLEIGREHQVTIYNKKEGS